MGQDRQVYCDTQPPQPQDTVYQAKHEMKCLRRAVSAFPQEKRIKDYPALGAVLGYKVLKTSHTARSEASLV